MFSLSFISVFFFNGIWDFLQQFNLGLKPRQNLSRIAERACKEGLVAGIPGKAGGPGGPGGPAAPWLRWSPGAI